jgi:hypothetical protein
MAKLADETIDPHLLRSAMPKSVLNPVSHCIAVLLAFVDTRPSVALYAILPLLSLFRAGWKEYLQRTKESQPAGGKYGWRPRFARG